MARRRQDRKLWLTSQAEQRPARQPEVIFDMPLTALRVRGHHRRRDAVGAGVRLPPIDDHVGVLDVTKDPAQLQVARRIPSRDDDEKPNRRSIRRRGRHDWRALGPVAPVCVDQWYRRLPTVGTVPLPPPMGKDEEEAPVEHHDSHQEDDRGDQSGGECLRRAECAHSARPKT